jgi:hypothetical protein
MARLNEVEHLPEAPQIKGYLESASGRKALIKRRASTRITVRWKALLVRDDAKPSRECTFRDISETGATIALQDPGDLPDVFTIDITARGGPKRICRLVWKSGTEIGVAFQAEIMLKPGMSQGEAVNAFGIGQ